LSTAKALANLNEQTDVRRPRRALALEEMSQLVEAARNSGKYAQRLSPEYRARLYTFALLTGLRRKEIASLTASSFRLDDDPPTLAVEAADSKHRRKDLLPLHHDLVAKLRGWLVGLKPSDKLFPGLAKKDTAKLMKADLKRAGLEYKSIEGFADFHATRHTYITQLLRSGASLPVTKELARHSNVNQTMRYTHIGINDWAKAVSNLPSLQESPKPPATINPGEDAALHMRCNSGGAPGHSPSTNGTPDAASDRSNPKQDKGFGKNCHRLAFNDKMGASGQRPNHFSKKVGPLGRKRLREVPSVYQGCALRSINCWAFGPITISLQLPMAIALATSVPVGALHWRCKAMTRKVTL
jgi:hypothetical protein